MVSLEVIAFLLSGISISASLFYYANVLSNANKTQRTQLETRQAQLFMNIYKEDLTDRASKSLYLVMDMEYEDFDDFEEKYGRENNPEAHALLNFHINYMEGLGVLVREGYVDIRLVALLSSGGVRLGREKLKAYTYEARERYNWPRWSIEYGYLYETLMDYAEKNPELMIKP